MKHKSLNKKKIPSDKINGTKNVLFFLSRAPTHHSFTFNFRSYMSLSKMFVSVKLYVGFFIEVYIFVQQNAWTLNVTIPFKIRITEKSRSFAHTQSGAIQKPDSGRTVCKTYI